MTLRSLRAITLGWLLLLWWPAAGLAETADRCTEPVARIVSAQGTVEVQESGSSAWRAVALDGLLCPGDTVQTGTRSRAAILALNSSSILRVDQNTTLRFGAPPADDRSLLDLIFGVVNFFSREPQSGQRLARCWTCQSIRSGGGRREPGCPFFRPGFFLRPRDLFHDCRAFD